MELPINEKEFKIILELVKSKSPEIYNKLWTYKWNKDKQNKEN